MLNGIAITARKRRSELSSRGVTKSDATAAVVSQTSEVTILADTKIGTAIRQGSCGGKEVGSTGREGMRGGLGPMAAVKRGGGTSMRGLAKREGHAIGRLRKSSGNCERHHADKVEISATTIPLSLAVAVSGAVSHGAVVRQPIILRVIW